MSDHMDPSGIRRPNIDAALVQTRRALALLVAERERATEGREALDARINALRKFVDERGCNPRVPAEYRPPVRYRRKPPLGYKHPGVDPGRIPTYVLKGGTR